MAKPLDPALLRAVRSVRSAVIATALGVGAQTVAVVVAALALAQALGSLVTGTATLSQVAGAVAAVGVAMAARAILLGATERRAHRGATRVIADLRQRLLAHAVSLGPRWVEAHRTELTTLTTRGLDALEPYLVRYLPQLLQTAILTPALLVVIAWKDLLGAVILGGLIPLIVVFMWLIGVATQKATQRRLHSQQRLNARVLDLVAGLATLRAFGRAAGTVAAVKTLAGQERDGTMRTLRIAFLSGAVLETFATLSVAAVAVEVGLRLVSGDLDLVTGLAVLILAPEVLAPVRMVGTHFHASADGVAAVERCLRILDEPIPATAAGSGSVIGDVDELVWESVSVTHPGRDFATPQQLIGSVRCGAITVLSGPSGTGKTTAVHALLGLVEVDAGRVRARIADTWHDLGDLDPRWRDQVAWVTQHPVLEPGTIADIVGADREGCAAAAALTGFDEVVQTLPQQWDTPLGWRGRGLSAGQRQRLALTRALLSPARVVVLDEPTAHLDRSHSAHLMATVRHLADEGRAVLVLTHAREFVDIADSHIELRLAVTA